MSDNPLGGWSVEVGVWGVDVDRETTIVQQGANAIKFISTALAHVRIRSDYKPIIPSSPQKLWGLLRADDNTKDVRLALLWYTEAKAFISIDYAIDGVLPAADTWYDVSATFNAPVNANLARVMVGRASANFNAYSAYAGIAPFPVGFSAYLDANTGYVSASVVVFDVEDFDYGSNYNNATGEFTAPADGVYSFNAQLWGIDFNAGHSCVAQLYIDGALSRTGGLLYAHNNAVSMIVTGAWTIALARGAVAKIVVVHNFGAARTFLGDIGAYKSCSFTGFRVE